MIRHNTIGLIGHARASLCGWIRLGLGMGMGLGLRANRQQAMGDSKVNTWKWI